jgi:hypothetical protein
MSKENKEYWIGVVAGASINKSAKTITFTDKELGKYVHEFVLPKANIKEKENKLILEVKYLHLEIPETVIGKEFIRGYFESNGNVREKTILLSGKECVLKAINAAFKEYYPHKVNIYHNKRFVLEYRGSTAIAFLHFIYKDADIFYEGRYHYYEKVKDETVWTREDREWAKIT